MTSNRKCGRPIHHPGKHASEDIWLKRRTEALERAALDPEAERERNRVWRLLSCYGLTVDEYEAMLHAQDGRCAVCRRPPLKIRLAVDHEHQRNEKRRSGAERRPFIRGLLCHRCNRALGLLVGDSQHLVEQSFNLHRYLKDYERRKAVADA